jgi:UDP-N-acetyl-2-amino-2-deoxyglucuronate dehydrogenase
MTRWGFWISTSPTRRSSRRWSGSTGTWRSCGVARWSTSRIHYMSVCSPNHLHDAHIRLALRIGADADLREAPRPESMEPRCARRAGEGIWPEDLQCPPAPGPSKANRFAGVTPEDSREETSGPVEYVTSRGTWYRYSWKGDREEVRRDRTNIGIHFFDMLIWFFGGVRRRGSWWRRHPDGWRAGVGKGRRRVVPVHRGADLPDEARGLQPTYRSITVDGEEVEFSGGFRDLHTLVYEEILNGGGFTIEDARPSIELVHDTEECGR